MKQRHLPIFKYDKSKLNFSIVALYLLVFSIPFGVAGQNIISGLAGVFFVVDLSRQGLLKGVGPRLTFYHGSVLLSLGLVLSMTLGTWLNPGIGGKVSELLGSHAFFVLLPWLLAVVGYQISEKSIHVLEKFIIWVVFVVGLVSLGQYFAGWFVKGDWGVPIRAKGFYSHPLTFAYVMFLFWPWAIVRLFRKNNDPYSWILFLGVGSSLLTSESRTVIAVGGVLLAFNTIFLLKGKIRIYFIAGSVLSFGALMLSDNPISRKTIGTISGTFDNQSGYPDDRVAFWHAHGLMIHERPWFGHGVRVDDQYRKKYYEEIGLGELEKQYSAHNVFLQYWVNGGVFAVLFFLAWMVWVMVLAKKSWRSRDFSLGLYQLVPAFLLVSMTQNSFQDTEVRYVFTLLVGLLCMMTVAKPERG
jgi:O-antigen ligase